MFMKKNPWNPTNPRLGTRRAVILKSGGSFSGFWFLCQICRTHHVLHTLMFRNHIHMDENKCLHTVLKTSWLYIYIYIKVQPSQLQCCCARYDACYHNVLYKIFFVLK